MQEFPSFVYSRVYREGDHFPQYLEAVPQAILREWCISHNDASTHRWRPYVLDMF